MRYVGAPLACAQTPGTAGAECSVLLAGGATVLARFAREPPAIGINILMRAQMTPFDGPRNPGEPDQRVIEAERGNAATLEHAAILRVLGPAPANLPIIIARLHVAAGERLRRYLAEPFASIVAGELWGERSAIPADLREEFQDTGTVHVLVTAGLHLAVVAMVVMACLQWFATPRIFACILAAAIIWAYVLFSGSHVPAIRAGTMISFALAARAAGAKAVSWNGLAAAAIVVILTVPQSILSASFAMSFSCVGAIILTGSLIEKGLERLALPAPFLESLTLTLATQIGVWPLTGAVFLLFAPYAIVANAAVVPVVGLTMILAMIHIALADIYPVAHAIANLNAWLLTWMVSVIRVTSSLPYSHIVMTPAPLWALCSYDVALVCAAWLFRRGALTAACGLIIFAAGFVVAPPQRFDRNLEISMLDVGQADSIVIRTPAGHVFLVDGGGRLERGAHVSAESVAERVGERTVVPFLIRHGIHHVDAVLLSHPHGDHAGGLAPVLRSLGADKFADSGQHYGGFAYRDAISVAHANSTPIVYPRAGTTWRTNDGVTLTFLGPQPPFIAGSRNDINNNSLTFILQYATFRMLFTGDAGAEAEKRILAEGVDLRSTVLKVGHHGSAYSSTPEFIAAVHPKYAVISVGRHNLFGHPAPSTIATLEQTGAQIYRTDENGAITVTTDGSSAALHPMLFIPNAR